MDSSLSSSESVNLPKYCDFFQFLLIEELLLETELRRLHYGKCKVIGCLVKETDGNKVFLGNVRIKNLPSAYALPEGTLKICLLDLKNKYKNNAILEVSGEVILLKNSKKKSTKYPNETTSWNLLKYFDSNSQEDINELNIKFREVYTPAIKVIFELEAVNASELISYNLEARMLQQCLDLET